MILSFYLSIGKIYINVCDRRIRQRYCATFFYVSGCGKGVETGVMKSLCCCPDIVCSLGRDGDRTGH